MKILKKINNNNFNLFKSKNYFKTLILKNKTILFKNQILLKMNNFYLLNINNHENIFYPLKNKTKLDLKNFIFFISKKYKDKFLIESNNYNYYLFKLYIYIIIKKLKQEQIFKKYNIIKGRILKKYKKRILISFFGSIFSMHKKELHKKKKLLYSRFKYNRLFFFYKLKYLNFRFKFSKKKRKIKFSRKRYVDLKKKKKNATI